jgi:UDP-N-acetylglucosamine transferase subunit ALG13
MPAHELAEVRRTVDVVVAHAGIGSALDSIAAGQCPILVSREHDFGEHVDDHQQQIGIELDRRGLALHRHPDTLTFEDLLTAARRTVVQVHEPPPFVLEDEPAGAGTEPLSGAGAPVAGREP